MTIEQDLIDAGLPDPTGHTWREYTRLLNPDQRSTAEALRIDYMDAERRTTALRARPDLAFRLDNARRDITGRRDIHEKHRETLDNLDLIIDAKSMTATQMFQAVKFLARTLKLILKIIARQYREESE